MSPAGARKNDAIAKERRVFICGLLFNSKILEFLQARLVGRVGWAFLRLEEMGVAGGLGFEPRLTGPEPVVLPLDDPPEVAPKYRTPRP